MYDAILIDQMFCSRKVEEAVATYRASYPDRALPPVDLASLLTFLTDSLRLGKQVSAHIYGPEGVLPLFWDVEELHLSNGRFIAMVHQWTADPVKAIVQDIEAQRGNWDRLILVGDDARYGELIRDPNEIDVLVRLGTDETAMADFGSVRWQNLNDVVGYTMGLDTHEL